MLDTIETPAEDPEPVTQAELQTDLTEPETSTSTSTSTSTTTTTSTTTKAPTKEELILGTCDTSFEADSRLINKDGSLKDPEQYGFWVQSCGTQFVFGKSLATWRDNFIKCRQIGMEPISFENETKLECFKNMVSKWKYSSNYWTSGLRVSASKFSWCKKDGSIAVDKSKLTWAAGQPDNVNNTENCVHLNVVKSNSSFYFSDRTCTDPQIFACQGPPTPAPACSSPVCPNVTCAKNLTYYSTLGTSQFITKPEQFGSWLTINGRMYLYSFQDVKTTFSGAMAACCEIGMTLLSLEYDYKYKSVIAAIKNNVTSSDYFWTSGSDKGCESNYGYCSAKRLIRKEAIWASGQPDNADGNESAVAVYITDAKAQLFDFNEESKYRYVCEARDTSKAKSGGSAVRDECTSIYNVSQVEIDTVLNNTNKLDLRLKCFLKCLGENSGLMVNGKFLENEVLAILENLAHGNLDDLQKNMGIMDDCGKASTGMDECDKAAQMIGCSNEKAPDVLNGVIMAMDQSIPVENAPLPPEAYCYNSSECPSASLYLKYAQEISACSADCQATYGVVKFCGGKKYYFDARVMDFKSSFANCCNLGLKLASITSIDQINCLASFSFPNQNTWHWMAASKMNSSIPRWCTSAIPFNFSIFNSTWDDPAAAYDSYVITPISKTMSVTQQSTGRYSICEPI
ncbi:uncharacterized protein LOC135945280 [Cloeon dipterum]|uniref:uncharacterized protein LOC135945280 n=1 Tax=Cloeon dipterum TaxID=197152 RepID=UPI00321F65BE